MHIKANNFVFETVDAEPDTPVAIWLKKNPNILTISEGQVRDLLNEKYVYISKDDFGAFLVLKKETDNGYTTNRL